MILHLSHMSTRLQLPAELQQCGLTQPVVEVGVHRGDFAVHLVRHCHNSYVGVDPWDLAEDYDAEQVGTLWGGEYVGTENHERVARRRIEDAWMKRWGHRRGSGVNPMTTRILKCTSTKAAPQFQDGSLALVYLDGNHRRAHVLEDLMSWYPKLVAGGLLAGHDFICPGEVNGGWGQEVQPAVFEFMDRHLSQTPNPDLYLIAEENGLPWTFYLVKA